MEIKEFERKLDADEMKFIKSKLFDEIPMIEFYQDRKTGEIFKVSYRVHCEAIHVDKVHFDELESENLKETVEEFEKKL